VRGPPLTGDEIQTAERGKGLSPRRADMRFFLIALVCVIVPRWGTLELQDGWYSLRGLFLTSSFPSTRA
jgi:hypothetical protein